MLKTRNRGVKFPLMSVYVSGDISRLTTAMHLLQSGNDISVIKGLAGTCRLEHKPTATSKIDMKLKRKSAPER